jgi:hypothetical protein
MWDGANETEQLPDVSGLMPPSEALVEREAKISQRRCAAGIMVGGSAIQPPSGEE